MSETNSFAEHLVRTAVENMNQLRIAEDLQPLAFSEDTRLMGADGEVDSLQLLTLLVDLESRVSAKCGRQVILMNDQALQNANFATIGSLTAYVSGVLNQ